MERLLDHIRKLGGFARMRDLKNASFHPRTIARLLEEGKLEKVKPGLYRLADDTQLEIARVLGFDFNHRMG